MKDFVNTYVKHSWPVQPARSTLTGVGGTLFSPDLSIEALCFIFFAITGLLYNSIVNSRQREGTVNRVLDTLH